jgi:Ion channel
VKDQLTVREKGTRIQAWLDRIAEPSLTALLLLELLALFLALPLSAEEGIPMARGLGEALLLVVVVIVVMLSQKRGAIAVILLGLAATAASLLLDLETSSVAVSMLGRGGNILTFSALGSVVARAVYAPGRITSYRLQGAVVFYLNIGVIFGSAYRLIYQLNPAAFGNLPNSMDRSSEIATMLYFSYTTLTTTGYGDIVPVSPLARSLANLESIVGQLYLATAIARLVTLELQGRRL